MFARSLIPALLLGAVTPALAYDGHAYAYGQRAPAPTGVVQVVNRSGTTVTVTVDGQAPRMLGPNQVASLSVLAGEVRVRATFRLFGQELPLETVRTYVTPGRTTSAMLVAPTTARVLVSNSSPVLASVRADGREVATLVPGQERLLTLPARATTIALYADGHLVRTQRLEMRPFDEPRLRVEMPTRGDLVVQNPLPIPIQLVCDRGLVRTLEPYGRTEYEISPSGPSTSPRSGSPARSSTTTSTAWTPGSRPPGAWIPRTTGWSSSTTTTGSRPGSTWMVGSPRRSRPRWTPGC